MWRDNNFGRTQEEARNATAYLFRSTCVHADGVDAANAPRNRCVSENFTADKEKAAIGGTAEKEKAAIGGANVINMNASAPGYMPELRECKKKFSSWTNGVEFVSQRSAHSKDGCESVNGLGIVLALCANCVRLPVR